MQVYVLSFDARSSPTHAFDLVLSNQDVASCMVEAEQLRFRFMAPEPSAEKLVEQIYQRGGMLWCTRHGGVAPPPEQGPA